MEVAGWGIRPAVSFYDGDAMAGDWIKMRSNLWTCPEVLRIVSALERPRAHIIGALHGVWALFDAHSSDGTLSNMPPGTLDKMTGTDDLEAAMIDVGWLEVQDAGGVRSYVLPGYEEHNGPTAKRRAKDQKRKKAVRIVSASNADQRRGEEIRGDKSKEEEPASAGSGAHPPDEAPGSGLILPTRSGTWELPEQKRAEYDAVYGGQVNVATELLKARLWLQEHPKRRKQGRRGTLSFLTGWLNRATENIKPDGPTINVEAGVDAVREEVAAQRAAQDAEPWQPIGGDIAAALKSTKETE